MSMENSKLRLSPPWYSYQRKVFALFGSDPQVKMRDLCQVDEANYRIDMLVCNGLKAQAIRALLPRTVQISGVTVTTRVLFPMEHCEVRPSSQECDAQLLEDAFTGNPIFDRVGAHSSPFGGPQIGYCIFKKQVIQFWDDDLSNYYGLHTTLAENIARDVLKPTTVQFCTGTD